MTAEIDDDDDATAIESTDRQHDVDPTGHSGSTWKVLGTIDAPDGSGVIGHNTATSGTAFGVQGVTESSTYDAAGVRAAAPNVGHGLHASAADDAVWASATNGFGVFGVSRTGDAIKGEAKDGDTIAVNGFNEARTTPAGTGFGVWGTTRSVGFGSSGVRGIASGDSGETYGVRGESESGDAGAAGVRGEAVAASGTETDGVWGRSASNAGYGLYADGDSKTVGDHEIGGTLVGSGLVGTGNIAAGAVTDAEIDATTTISRGKLETDRTTIQIDSSGTSAYPTSGEETVFVDPSSQTVTITLSDSDAVDGRTIRIVDQTGTASSSAIFIEAGMNYSLEGSSSSTISSDRGYRTYQFFDVVWHEVGSS